MLEIAITISHGDRFDMLTLITLLLAEMLSILICNSIEMDEQSAKAFTPSGILKVAGERLVESG